MLTDLFGTFGSLFESDRSCSPSHFVRVDAASIRRAGLLSPRGLQAWSIDRPPIERQAPAPLDHLEEEDRARNHRHFHCRNRYRTEARVVQMKMRWEVMKDQLLSFSAMEALTENHYLFPH